MNQTLFSPIPDNEMITEKHVPQRPVLGLGIGVNFIV